MSDSEQAQFGGRPKDELNWAVRVVCQGKQFYGMLDGQAKFSTNSGWFTSSMRSTSAPSMMSLFAGGSSSELLAAAAAPPELLPVAVAPPELLVLCSFSARSVASRAALTASLEAAVLLSAVVVGAWTALAGSEVPAPASAAGAALAPLVLRLEPCL
eukprot:6475746-Amphidinium_carterae.1